MSYIFYKIKIKSTLISLFESFTIVLNIHVEKAKVRAVGILVIAIQNHPLSCWCATFECVYRNA